MLARFSGARRAAGALRRRFPRMMRNPAAIRPAKVALGRTALYSSRRHKSSSSSASGGGVLVFADHSNGSLAGSTLSAVTAAAGLASGDVSVLVAGGKGAAETAAKAAAAVSGVSRVLVAGNDDLYANALAEPTAALLAKVQARHGFSHIVATSSATGKSVVPRLGALLDTQPITDVVSIEASNRFVRPIYAGNAMATVESDDSTLLLTVRPTNFEKAAAEGGSANVEEVGAEDQVAPEAKSTSVWESEEVSKSERPDLSSARVVVSGGRGMKEGKNFEMLEKLADKLGGAVGASRAAVDAGFVPNELQVGQTGKVVAPELYIAVGISGAIQHLAGMKDSKVIVAINKDPDASIFQVADYGVVGDLFTAVPELDAELAK